MYLYNNNNYYYSFWSWKPFRTIILSITAMWYFLSLYCWIQFVNILLKCSVAIFMRNIVCLIMWWFFEFWYQNNFGNISVYVFFSVFLIVMFLGESVYIWCDFSSKKWLEKLAQENLWLVVLLLLFAWMLQGINLVSVVDVEAFTLLADWFCRLSMIQSFHNLSVSCK